MKTLSALLASFLLFLASSAEAQVSVVPATRASVPITGTVATSTLLITGVSGQRIYVTSLLLAPVATSVVTFTQGFGATCATNASSVAGVMTFGVTSTVAWGTGQGALWVLDLGTSLCVTIATAAAPGSITYDRF